jgi:hypothetical protein
MMVSFFDRSLIMARVLNKSLSSSEQRVNQPRRTRLVEPSLSEHPSIFLMLSLDRTRLG